MSRPVVGLDLSLASTGIAVDHGDGFRETQRVRSSGKAGASWEQRSARLYGLSREIMAHIPTGALVVVEGPSYGSVGSGTHDRSGLWWLVFRGLQEKGCTIVPVSPAQRMMYATGKGGGKDTGKDNVLAAAIKRYPEIDITGNDVADAVIFMAIGCRLDGHPIEDSLPAANLRAMDKIELPKTLVA